MLELNESHTGEYLAKVICALLSEYDVKPQQVIAITTDNGANVVKMVRDVATQMTTIENTHQTPSRRDENIAPCDTEIEAYLHNVPDYTDEQALDILFEEIDSENEIDDTVFADHDALLNAMVSSLLNSNESDFAELIKGFRCVAHTLQLGIHDGLSNISQETKNIISLCGRIAKTLRLKSIEYELKSAGIQFSVPQLDVVTRWCSTYIMVSINFSFFYLSTSIILYGTSKNVLLLL